MGIVPESDACRRKVMFAQVIDVKDEELRIFLEFQNLASFIECPAKRHAWQALLFDAILVSLPTREQIPEVPNLGRVPTITNVA
jgi:hypothetical protein